MILPQMPKGQGGAGLVIYLSQSNLDIPREGVGTVAGCGNSGKKEMDISPWKEASSFSLCYEDYPGHVTFSLIAEASAVLQLHGYHVQVSEGNHNSATLLRWGGEQIRHRNAFRALWERGMPWRVTPKASLWGDLWEESYLGSSCWRNPTQSALHFCPGIISPLKWKVK